MQISRRFWITLFSCAAAVTPLFLALALPATSNRDTALLQTPQQVVDTLDSIVQPRFRQNAGQFGVDRVIFPGHDNIYGLAAASPRETSRLRQINAAHRPYVVAFLHCAHKPGNNVGSKTPAQEYPVKLSVETLATATSTNTGSQRLMDWGGDNLNKVVLPAWPVLKQGTGVDQSFGNWQVVMRPVRASASSCLGCHIGAKRGDTLGVMVYAVDKNAIHADIKSFQEGEE